MVAARGACPCAGWRWVGKRGLSTGMLERPGVIHSFDAGNQIRPDSELAYPEVGCG